MDSNTNFGWENKDETAKNLKGSYLVASAVYLGFFLLLFLQIDFQKDPVNYILFSLVLSLASLGASVLTLMELVNKNRE